jgi:hypothetical protein
MWEKTVYQMAASASIILRARERYSLDFSFPAGASDKAAGLRVSFYF